MSRPWFPFYVGDYVRDTARLTTEGHGAYLLLMLDYWVNGAPPDDDETLASIARLSLEQWSKLRPRIAQFFQIEGGRWSHGRIEKELASAEEKYRKRALAGSEGGKAKAKNQQSSSNASPELPALLYQPQPQPQPLKEALSRSKDRPEGAPDPKQIDLEEAIASAPKPAASRFDEFWRAYPRRDGPNPRKPAEARFNTLVKTGLDPEMLIAEAKKLAVDEGKRGNVGTRFIPQAATWLNQQRWSDHAAVAFLVAEMSPADRAKAEAEQLEKAVEFFSRSGVWSRHAGASPDLPGCRASPALLAKYGLAPDGRKLALAS